MISLSVELQKLGVHITGPVFSDDSTELAPSPLEVATMLGQQEATNAIPMAAEPLTLPRIEVAEW